MPNNMNVTESRGTNAVFHRLFPYYGTVMAIVKNVELTDIFQHVGMGSIPKSVPFSAKILVV